MIDRWDRTVTVAPSEDGSQDVYTVAGSGSVSTISLPAGTPLAVAMQTIEGMRPVGMKDPPTVDQALAALSDLLAVKEAAGVLYQPLGYPKAALFLTDPSSIGKISSAYQAADSNLWVDGTPIQADGVQFVPMTRNDVLLLGRKALAYVTQCGVQAARLAVLVRQNPAITLDQGWPSQA